MESRQFSGVDRGPLERDPAYQALCTLVWSKLGLDLAHYKQSCVERRLAVRLRARGCATLAEYLGSISNDEKELRQFLSTITATVTEFFRNLETFERIREVCLPRMFVKGCVEGSNRNNRERLTDPVRIWSVGCASGEESYSIAILVREFLSAHPDVRPRSAEIYATDMDASMIARAKEGLYEERRTTKVSPERRKRWFDQEANGWRPSRRIRSMVSYEVANAFRHSPEMKQDLIVCRNMLIYIARDQQEKIFERFHSALIKGGFLVLGKTELLTSSARRMFKTVCAGERIYQAFG